MNKISHKILSIVVILGTFFLAGCDAFPEFRELQEDSDKVDSKGVTKVSFDLNYPKTRGIEAIKVNSGYLVIFRCQDRQDYDDYLNQDEYYRDFYIEKVIQLNLSAGGQPTNLKDLSVGNGSKLFLIAINYCPVTLSDFNADGTPKSSTQKNYDPQIQVDITKPTQIYSGAYYYQNLSGGSVTLSIRMNILYDQINLIFNDPGITKMTWRAGGWPVYLYKTDGTYELTSKSLNNGDQAEYKIQYKVELTVPDKISANHFRINSRSINETMYTWNLPTGNLQKGGNSGSKTVTYEYMPLQGNKVNTIYPAACMNFTCKYYAKCWFKYMFRLVDKNFLLCTQTNDYDSNKLFAWPFDANFLYIDKTQNYIDLSEWSHFKSFEASYSKVANYKYISNTKYNIRNTPYEAVFKNIDLNVNNTIPGKIYGDSKIYEQYKYLDRLN